MTRFDRNWFPVDVFNQLTVGRRMCFVFHMKKRQFFFKKKTKKLFYFSRLTQSMASSRYRVFFYRVFFRTGSMGPKRNWTSIRLVAAGTNQRLWFRGSDEAWFQFCGIEKQSVKNAIKSNEKWMILNVSVKWNLISSSRRILQL